MKKMALIGFLVVIFGFSVVINNILANEKVFTDKTVISEMVSRILNIFSNRNQIPVRRDLNNSEKPVMVWEKNVGYLYTGWLSTIIFKKESFELSLTPLNNAKAQEKLGFKKDPLLVELFYIDGNCQCPTKRIVARLTVLPTEKFYDEVEELYELGQKFSMRQIEWQKQIDNKEAIEKAFK